MGQIIDHPWLEGCHWPSEDRGYRPYPRLAAENLSDSEKAVFQELSELGVSTQLLRQEMVQGVRSPAIAAYRIILHRTLITDQQQQCDLQQESEQRLASNAKSQTVRPASEIPNLCLALTPDL